MKIFESVSELRSMLEVVKRPVGLVPTMGSLHEGHLALVRRARTENETLVVSVFVNPSQFERDEDLESYPRNIDADIDILEKVGVDAIFTPSVAEMYPNGFDTIVNAGEIAERLEGEFRPSHFNGVATIVCKLISIVKPNHAYFGQKDAQQGVVVSRINTDLGLGAEIVMVPTVRDSDGLALSSRNARLSPPERKAANVLYKSLLLAKNLETPDAKTIRSQMRLLIGKEPLARVEYVSISDPCTLKEVHMIEGSALVSLAVWVGNTRLIDNKTLHLGCQTKTYT